MDPRKVLHAVVQAEPVVGNVEEEPRERSAGEKQAVLGDRVVAHKVTKAGLLDLEALVGLLGRRNARQLVHMGLAPFAGNVVLGVLVGLLDITGNVEGVAGGLGDGQAVVQRDAAGDGAKANERAPHLVDGHGAVAGAVGGLGRGREGVLEAEGDEEHDEGGAQLAEPLHGEDGAHHGATPLGGRKLGRDDAREGVVAADTDAHQHAPEDDHAYDRHGGRVAAQGVGEGSEDDDHEL